MVWIKKIRVEHGCSFRAKYLPNVNAILVWLAEKCFFYTHILIVDACKWTIQFFSKYFSGLFQMNHLCWKFENDSSRENGLSRFAFAIIMVLNLLVCTSSSVISKLLFLWVWTFECTDKKNDSINWETRQSPTKYTYKCIFLLIKSKMKTLFCYQTFVASVYWLLFGQRWL